MHAIATIDRFSEWIGAAPPAASSSSYTYGDSYGQMYQRSTEQAGQR